MCWSINYQARIFYTFFVLFYTTHNSLAFAIHLFKLWETFNLSPHLLPFVIFPRSTCYFTVNNELVSDVGAIHNYLNYPTSNNLCAMHVCTTFCFDDSPKKPKFMQTFTSKRTSHRLVHVAVPGTPKGFSTIRLNFRTTSTIQTYRETVAAWPVARMMSADRGSW